MTWYYSYIKGKIIDNFIRKKYHPSKYVSKKMYSVNESNTFIYDSIISGDPFMVCRFGARELGLLSDYEAVKIGIKNSVSEKKFSNLNTFAGFFPNDISMAKSFAEIYFQDAKYADWIGVWYVSFEDYLIRKYAKDSKLTFLKALEPWNSDNPWSAALKGKKVLVVHPFVESIQKQYTIREKLFPGKDVLPDFELKTFKAVQTVAGQKDKRFDTWFDALNYMTEEIMKIEFDVAILGCGAYGFPLAARIKRSGKQAIHMGGATQLLFGIKGARWDNHPVVSTLYNEHWVRPLESERPRSANKVENGCYW